MTCAIRTKRRLLRAAAEILERDAAILRDSHSVRGDWGTDECDKIAKTDHDEMLMIARDLRSAAGGA